MGSEALPILVQWEKVLGDLLDRTQKFPKAVRFTFSTRIDNLALGVLERLIEARYSRERTGTLRAANLDLEKLRILLRLCHERQYLDHRGFEHVVRNLDETGRMVGGWLKQQAAKDPP